MNIRTFLQIIILFTAVNNLNSTNYFVSTTGDDNSDGSLSQPYRTIQKAANVARGGDTVFIRQGTYYEAVNIYNSGSLNSHIVFSNYRSEEVIVDGTGFDLVWVGVITIISKSNITINGLRVVNSSGTGIFSDSSYYINITNNRTFNTSSSGIGIWGSKNIKILNNIVENACWGGSQECITVAICDSFETSGNQVFDCAKEGICLKDGSRNGLAEGNVVRDVFPRLGIYVDAWDKYQYNITVKGNNVFNCADGIVVASEMGGLCENIFIINNIVHNNRNVGINISNNGDDTTVKFHPIRNVYIINNTIVNNGQTWGGGIGNGNRDATNIVVRNNILSENLSFQITHEGIQPSNMTIDHNLINGFRNYPDEERGTEYIEGNPLLADTAARNFHLLANSPAIDKGSGLDAPSDDYEHQSRPYGKGFDIGAYEWRGPVGFETFQIISDDLSIYPNPFVDYCLIRANDAKIEIFDSFGNSIAKSSEKLIWKPEGWISGGIYFIRFSGKRNSTSKQLIYLK